MTRTFKIIIATDGSACSKEAVEEFAGRPLPINADIRIVSAFEKTLLMVDVPLGVPAMGIYSEYNTEADKAALQAAEHATDEAAFTLRKKNPALSITTAIIEGSPKDIILQEAAEFNADLIVVGSHGRGAVERLLLGSVSQAVALHAKCSVEIVRTKYLQADEHK